MAGAGKDAREHRGRQAPGIRVEAAAVIGIEETSPPWQLVLGAMGEVVGRRPLAQCPEDRAVRDGSERHDHAADRQSRELPDQVAIAAPDFIGARLVAGRQALHGVADAAIEQAKPVVGRDRLGARRESCRVQGAVQEDARMVAREGSAAAIGAMLSRRQPDDEKAVARAAERCDRPAMVLRVLGPDGVEVTRQAWAEPAARVELGPGPIQRALNCASSVEPRIAVIDELPPVTVCVTSSK
ncbi:MAG TPA: hypothetical protein VL219_04680 [Steroidobacteraceae bacterium]|nr:hypothetical protein [Steroidobacteraceae bacterium]